MQIELNPRDIGTKIEFEGKFIQFMDFVSIVMQRAKQELLDDFYQSGIIHNVCIPDDESKCLNCWVVEKIKKMHGLE